MDAESKRYVDQQNAQLKKELLSKISGNTKNVNKADNTSIVCEWGKISGDIAAQSDLLNILSSKVSVSSLATVATSGNYNDLSNKPTIPILPTLSTVATSGNYTDLSGKPVLGTAAALDVGTTANKVVQLDTTGKLPPVDGSQLINLPLSGVDIRNPSNPNLLVNGDFKVGQTGTSFNSVASSTYVYDMWRVYHGAGGVFNISQDTDVPADVSVTQSLKINTVTPLVTNGSNTFYLITGIEGGKIAPYVGKALTLSFYVKSAKPGIYSGFLRNTGNDRSFVFEFEATAAWSRVIITVPLNYSGGTWNYSTGLGLMLGFYLANPYSIASATATLNQWLVGSYTQSTRASNALDTAGNDFLITAVKLESGTEATDFVPLFIADNLAECQRYLFDSNYAMMNYRGAFHTTTGNGVNAVGVYDFPVPMRTTPAVSVAGAYIWNTNGGYTGLTVPGDPWTTPQGFVCLQRLATYSAGQWITPYGVIADARLI